MSMQFVDAKEINIQQLLSNPSEAYRVPKYQRTYAWAEDQWRDLFDDISMLDENNPHFLGSIVVIPEDRHRLGLNYFEVVDGQQRLATILIWLSVIRDIVESRDQPDFARHLRSFLFSRDWNEGAETLVPKLQLGTHDDDAIARILEGRAMVKGHPITECYEFFREMTQETEVWRKLLANVTLVHINAFTQLNAFRLFETLNDRGLELSAADLLKNFMLSRLSHDKGLFERALVEWSEMYEEVRDKEPVKFLRRSMLATFKGKISEARLYDEIKNRVAGIDDRGMLDFVADLNRKASVYRKIVEADFAEPALNRMLLDLQLVEVSPSYTLLLKVMPAYESGSLSLSDTLEILGLIERFHIRWGVCGQSTSLLDQVYNEASIELAGVAPEGYAGKIREILDVHVRSNAADEFFVRSFTTRAFRPGERRTKYILWKLSLPTGETSMNTRDVQTEHIMPQGLSEEWVRYLMERTGLTEEEIEALHKVNLNTIGNLAIIKGEWNQSMSNRLYDRKVSDYSRSEFRLTKSLCEVNSWTFKEIEKRSVNLAFSAAEIWNWDMEPRS